MPCQIRSHFQYSPGENFLYGFKAALTGRARHRTGALADGLCYRAGRRRARVPPVGAHNKAPEGRLTHRQFSGAPAVPSWLRLVRTSVASECSDRYTLIKVAR